MDCGTGNGSVLNPQVLNSQIEHLHQTDHNQVNCHNQIEQSRNGKNQDARDECNNAAQPEIDSNLLGKEEVVKHGSFLYTR